MRLSGMSEVDEMSELSDGDGCERTGASNVLGLVSRRVPEEKICPTQAAFLRLIVPSLHHEEWGKMLTLRLNKEEHSC